MATKRYNNYSDMITFSRASSGTALAKISYGSEMLANGTFDDATGWTLALNTAVSGGVLNFINAGFAATCSYQIGYTANTAVKISVDVSISSGRVEIWLGGTALGSYAVISAITTSGTYEAVVNSAGTDGNIYVRSLLAGTNATVDNLSVKPVLYDQPDGTLQLFNHPTDHPRVEYDYQGNRLGLLVEEARTNLVTYSEDFTVGTWGKTNVTVTANAGISPDGTVSAIKMVEGTGTQFNFINFAVTLGAAAHTFSAYLKAAERTTASFFLSQGGNNGATFDLLAGTVSSVVGTGNTATIESVGNGWYRCSVTNDGSSDITDFVRIGVQNGAYSSYLGDGTSGIYIWGAQLEAGTFPTSYIPTSGATATRSADTASIGVGAFGYNKTAGSFVIQFKTVADAYHAINFNTDSNNRVVIYGSGSPSSVYAYERNAGAVSSNVVISSAPTDFTKAAIAIKNNSSAAADGITYSMNATSWPPVTEVDIGMTETSSFQLNGHISSIAYYPRRLTDAQLQELTS